MLRISLDMLDRAQAGVMCSLAIQRAGRVGRHTMQYSGIGHKTHRAEWLAGGDEGREGGKGQPCDS